MNDSIVFDCSQIFSTLKAPIDKYYATILLGAAELVGAFTSILVVHSIGKRPLVFTSLIGTGLCLFATATYAHFLNTIPGVAVNNVVANYSHVNVDHASFIDLRNLTEALNTTEYENALDYGTTSDYLSTLDDDSVETPTTLRVKRMKSDSVVAPNVTLIEDDSKIILPIAKENRYLWLPLTLLIAGAAFSHLGTHIIAQTQSLNDIIKVSF